MELPQIRESLEQHVLHVVFGIRGIVQNTARGRQDSACVTPCKNIKCIVISTPSPMQQICFAKNSILRHFLSDPFEGGSFCGHTISKLQVRAAPYPQLLETEVLSTYLVCSRRLESSTIRTKKCTELL